MEVLVISSYPEKDQIHGEKTVGVGYYTKATLLALVKASPQIKLKVWAEVFDKKESYVENNIMVERFWKRGSIFSLFNLFIKAAKDETKVVMLPFEMFMFGHLVHVAFTLPLMLLLKLRGKKIVLVVHQVLGGSLLAFEKNPLKAMVLGSFRKIFYSYLLFVSHRLVVFEEEFKDRLGGSSKVKVIPLAVIQEPHIDKKVARDQLGLDQDKKYILYFGFLSRYKGVVELLDIWEETEGVKLIIGGGGNPNHMGEPDYKAFIDETLQKAVKKGAMATGFIPEEQMLQYFCAADILILPYTVFMSSSGPLSHAFSQGMGVMFSSPLRGYFNSEDMNKALDEAEISIDEICFDLDKPIKSKVLWALHNLDKLEKFSGTMCKVRSWDTLSHQYDKVLKEAAE
jgi:glycosyltransferase involved in cell wall biosynthesis